jgi:hypothetical protein
MMSSSRLVPRHPTWWWVRVEGTGDSYTLADLQFESLLGRTLSLLCLMAAARLRRFRFVQLLDGEMPQVRGVAECAAQK